MTLSLHAHAYSHLAPDYDQLWTSLLATSNKEFEIACDTFLLPYLTTLRPNDFRHTPSEDELASLMHKLRTSLSDIFTSTSSIPLDKAFLS